MRITPKIAAFAIAGLALAAPATAMAASHSAAHHTGVSHSVVVSSEPAGPDHDSVQQGDQTSRDTASGTARTASSTSTPEPSSSEGESSTESESTVWDGPGGHADPSGNVQYEFNGVQ
jgi:hypothetical protein